jgi:hypothetical protein
MSNEILSKYALSGDKPSALTDAQWENTRPWMRDLSDDFGGWKRIPGCTKVSGEVSL